MDKIQILEKKYKHEMLSDLFQSTLTNDAVQGKCIQLVSKIKEGFHTILLI